MLHTSNSATLVATAYEKVASRRRLAKRINEMQHEIRSCEWAASAGAPDAMAKLALLKRKLDMLTKGE